MIFSWLVGFAAYNALLEHIDAYGEVLNNLKTHYIYKQTASTHKGGLGYFCAVEQGFFNKISDYFHDVWKVVLKKTIGLYRVDFVLLGLASHETIMNLMNQSNLVHAFPLKVVSVVSKDMHERYLSNWAEGEYHSLVLWLNKICLRMSVASCDLT